MEMLSKQLCKVGRQLLHLLIEQIKDQAKEVIWSK